MIESQSLPSWETIFQQVGERAPRRLRTRCPIHGGDSPTSLSLNEEKGVYFCHVCHASGDKVDFVRQVQGIDFKGALAFLGIESPCKPPRPDPDIIRQREALERVREWCRQTGRRLRDQYLMRQRIARYAGEKPAAAPETPSGGNFCGSRATARQGLNTCSMKSTSAAPMRSGFACGGATMMISEPALTANEINILRPGFGAGPDDCQIGRAHV
jgi:hypothetical protein